MKLIATAAAALTLTLPNSAYASEIRCEKSNNYSLQFEPTDDGFLVDLGDLGGHQLAVVLDLPLAGQAYRYTSARLEFSKDNCTVSRDGTLFSCYKENATVHLSYPEVTRNLTFASVQFERYTIERARWGRSEFYKATFDVRDAETGKHSGDSWNYNIDWCGTGR